MSTPLRPPSTRGAGVLSLACHLAAAYSSREPTVRIRRRRHMPRLFRSTALIALLALALAPAVLAQSQATTGVIEGTVLDASGAPVPGANVTIKNTATNFERVIQTDGDGRFRGLLLPLGPYRVTAALAGFATLVRDGINLAVGQTITLDLALKVSSVQE